MKDTIKEILNNHGIGGKLEENTTKELKDFLSKEVKKLIKEHKHEIKEGICESHYYLERVLKIIEK